MVRANEYVVDGDLHGVEHFTHRQITLQTMDNSINIAASSNTGRTSRTRVTAFQEGKQ